MKARKFIALALVTVMGCVSVFSIGAYAQGAWDGKTGQIKWYVDDPSASEFTINTAEELYGLSVICASNDTNASVMKDKKVYYDNDYNVVLDASAITETTMSVASTKFDGKTIKLAADIDLNNKPFLPIGSSGSFKAAIFDGQNHTVKNIYVDDTVAKHAAFNKGTNNAYYGLFAVITAGCTVKNLNYENVHLKITLAAKYIYAGGLMAQCGKDSTIDNCTAKNVKIEFDPPAEFNPVKCNIGAIVGIVTSTKAMTNISVTDFEFANPAESTKYVMSDDMFFGSGTTSDKFTGCSVTIKEASEDTSDIVGDVDGDGVISNADISLLIRYLSGWDDVDVNIENTDLTNDNKINNRDVIALIQRMSGWD